MSKTAEKKSPRQVIATLTKRQQELLERAAAIEGQSVSKFLVKAVESEAGRVVREHKILTLAGEDQDVFIRAVLDPPKPNETLKKAHRDYQSRVGRQ